MTVSNSQWLRRISLTESQITWPPQIYTHDSLKCSDLPKFSGFPTSFAERSREKYIAISVIAVGRMTKYQSHVLQARSWVWNVPACPSPHTSPRPPWVTIYSWLTGSLVRLTRHLPAGSMVHSRCCHLHLFSWNKGRRGLGCGNLLAVLTDHRQDPSPSQGRVPLWVLIIV